MSRDNRLLANKSTSMSTSFDVDLCPTGDKENEGVSMLVNMLMVTTSGRQLVGRYITDN